MENLYETLEVSQDASFNEIKKSYHRLALIFHPDKHTSNSDQNKFIKVGLAWKILSDEEERKKYDANWYNRNTTLSTTGPFHEHVNLDEFEKDENDEYSHPCRCGDFYVITDRDVRLKMDIIYCGMKSTMNLENECHILNVLK